MHCDAVFAFIETWQSAWLDFNCDRYSSSVYSWLEVKPVVVGVGFCVAHNYYFSYFAPPRKSDKILPPPWKNWNDVPASFHSKLYSIKTKQTYKVKQLTTFSNNFSNNRYVLKKIVDAKWLNCNKHKNFFFQ